MSLQMEKSKQILQDFVAIDIKMLAKQQNMEKEMATMREEIKHLRTKVTTMTAASQQDSTQPKTTFKDGAQMSYVYSVSLPHTVFSVAPAMTLALDPDYEKLYGQPIYEQFLRWGAPYWILIYMTVGVQASLIFFLREIVQTNEMSCTLIPWWLQMFAFWIFTTQI